jgi:hypothetical protein
LILEGNNNKSYLDHSPFLLRRVPDGRPFVVRFWFFEVSVLAVLALAVVAAGQSGLVALAVLLETA